MINNRPSLENNLGTPDLTPLIDIVFIVIVFLLITANSPLLTLPIDIPKANQESNLQTVNTSELTVTITAEQPYWHLEQQAFNNWHDFERALLLKNNHTTAAIIIAADKAAPSEPLLQLLALLNHNKIGNAKIIMQQSSY